MATMPGFTAESALGRGARPLGRDRAPAMRARVVVAQESHRHPPLKEPILSGGGGGIVVDIGPAVVESCACPCCINVEGHLVCCGPAPG